MAAVNPAVPARINVPEPIDFGTQDYVASNELSAVGQGLIHRYENFRHFEQAAITYLWKKKGGQSSGRPTLGKCQKPSGLLLHFAGCDFVVWVAADHAREYELRPEQIEALVFHKLCHAGQDVDEATGATRYAIVGHDVEAFAAEIKFFGLWKEDLREMGAVIRQLRLDEAR